jgi:CheY-like chemotaxis protein
MTRRVLVVDDDADLRFLLRMVLDREGESVVVAEASNGHEAIEAAAEHRPDVIVLDQAMPLMSGLEAIPELRTAAPDARIVMYSAYAETNQRASFEAIADAVVAKGGPLDELVAFVTAA